jgi:hypothetical protein
VVEFPSGLLGLIMASGAFAFGSTARNSRRKPAAKKAVAIGDLRHRITLCTASDVVVDGASIVIHRTEALKRWAKIEEKSGSLWSPEGVAVKESRDRQTHCIFVRRSKQFEISAAAWIYEARQDLPPRWFKILKVKEIEETGVYPWFWEFSCRLVEKSDLAIGPEKPGEAQIGTASKLPAGVKL